MAILFGRHTVADYAAWRRIFDDFAPTQKTLGVTDTAVYQAADNANDIRVTHVFAALEAAKAFAGSPELKTAMHDAGVTSPAAGPNGRPLFDSAVLIEPPARRLDRMALDARLTLRAAYYVPSAIDSAR